MNPEPNKLGRLIARLSDGKLNAEAMARLNELLRADPIAQEACLDHVALDGWLEWEFGGELPQVAPAGQRSPSTQTWPCLQWFSRPAFALLLIVVGFAMGATAWTMTTRFIAKQSLVKLPLAQAGFETGPAPLAQGVPTRAGMCCGDFAELVGSQLGIAPVEGAKMLRFLRSDSEVEPAGAATYVGDKFQVVDLRPWRETIADGNAVAELAASFNSVPGEEMNFETCLWAFTGDAASLPRNWSPQLRKELAYGSGSAHGSGDAKWQRVTGRMIVPTEAELLVLELKVFPASRKSVAGPVVFRGVFADDVEPHLQTGEHTQPGHPRRRDR